MRIGLSYDLKETIAIPQTGWDDALEEYDSWGTIELVAKALRAKGHKVTMLGGGREFLDRILHENVDFVFNIAEGRGTYRSREAQVPSILEMLDIPYSGSDPQCLAICLDKPLSKKLVISEGVNTPNWRVINDKQELLQIDSGNFLFPAIVKPAYEGSSKGIRLTSVVEDMKQAKSVIVSLLEKYEQPVMLEEIIPGDEVTVGIVGNSTPDVVGIMRIIPRQKDSYFIYNLDVKRNYMELVDYECPAGLEENVLQCIQVYSLRAFKALGCRDFARLDFRINAAGIPYFLEINPLPGLGTNSDLVIMAKKMRWSYQQLINTILDAALERYLACVSV
jgi:D-alanine-D-alanine ligase